MTTEIEKNFFDTFGIESRYEDACIVEDEYWNNEELANEYGTFDQYMNCKCGNQENCTTECSCAYQREIYPTISDRRLLELICICCKAFNLLNIELSVVFAFNIDEIKQSILTRLIWLDEVYHNKDIKHQVRTLFEEG